MRAATPLARNHYQRSSNTPSPSASWGGNILLGDDNMYHLYVSAMDDGAGLNGWTHQSRIDHAVAEDPMGVFKLSDTALKKEAHNASPLRAPNGSYVIFHIGNSGVKNGGSGFAHHSESPEGPWHPLSGPSCNNPAPMFVTNSTTAYVGCNNGGFKVYKSEDVFSGEWEFVSTMSFPDSWGGSAKEYLKNEDPYLWMDKRVRPSPNTLSGGGFITFFLPYCGQSSLIAGPSLIPKEKR